MATETVQQTQVRLEAFITELNPNADLAPGSVISELVAKLAASAQNVQFNEVEELNQGNAIQLVQENTVDTYSEVIDKIASNFNTVRYDGKFSTGKIKVTVDRLISSTLIPTNFTFTQTGLGLDYVTTQDWNLVTRIEPTSVNAIQLIANSDGTYYFIIPVQAAEVGSQYQVVNGTQFSLGEDSILPNFVLATAYGSFLTGLPKDTDKQLVAKIESNLSNKSVVSPRSINTLLRNEFTTFQGASVIGALDPEMLRSKRNAMGISTFGKADIYVRTSVGPETATVTIAGTKVSESTWTLKVTHDLVPGFYSIESILPTPVDGVVQAGTLNITDTTFSYFQEPNTRVNELTTVFDSRFTRYQEATVTFTYTEAPSLSNGSTADFDVSFKHQPNIADIQDIFVGDETRIVSADYLVKAAVPCFVSLEINLVKKNSSDTETTIGIQNLKKDIFNYINTIPFGESLYASKIVDICHNYAIKKVRLPIVMNGTIFSPDNSVISIANADVLEIPVDVDKGISPNTTLYFIDYYRQEGNDILNPIDNIGITLI